jgi:hypothetical protein
MKIPAKEAHQVPGLEAKRADGVVGEDEVIEMDAS